MQDPIQARQMAEAAPSRKPPSTAATLSTIVSADRNALLDIWREVLASPPPKGMSQVFLRRFLAFEVQARQHGGLPKALVDQIHREAAGRSRAAAPPLRPGGRLLREWNGVTHVVGILDDGCLWQGTTYPSLSAVARAITGARWSGPRFFGLKQQARASRSSVGHNRKGAGQ